jgi:crossover junction endodeoxyribonuclease RuvC
VHGRGAILGLDPGSRKTGFALVTFDGGAVGELEVGAWQVTPGLPRELALAQLADLAATWLAGRAIEVAAVESLFHHKNSRAALVLAEARGALLAVLGRGAVPVVEYSPATIKQTICGFGGADKEQVRRALSLTVPGLDRFPIESAGLDATDALAVAVTHNVHRRRTALVAQAPRR